MSIHYWTDNEPEEVITGASKNWLYKPGSKVLLVDHVEDSSDIVVRCM